MKSSESRIEIYRGNGSKQSLSTIKAENLLHNVEEFSAIKSKYENLELDCPLPIMSNPSDVLISCMEDIKTMNNDIVEFRIYERTR